MSPKPTDRVDGALFPQISVVIPIYNGETDLPELIRCLRSQTYPPDRFECLLVDNNSRDRTAEILQTASREENIGIRPLAQTEIQSSYAARNSGIKAAKGEILAFTDADCRPQSQWLERLVQPFAREAVGLVAGEIVALPGETLLERHAERHDTLSQKYTLAHPFCPYGQTANLAVRRCIFDRVGLFRPYLTTGGDADLCWRILRQTDWQLEFAPEAIVRHRHRTTLKQLRGQWRRYGQSNRYLHELHGVNLMGEPTRWQYLRRIARWLLKEIPKTGIKAVGAIGRSDTPTPQHQLLDILDTPIDLLNTIARARGQQNANLSEQAQKIEWLSEDRGESE